MKNTMFSQRAYSHSFPTLQPVVQQNQDKWKLIQFSLLHELNSCYGNHAKLAYFAAQHFLA